MLGLGVGSGASNTEPAPLALQASKVYNIFMKSAKKTGKPGRKPTGKTPLIALRLDVPTTARLDAWAARKGLSRSDAIRDMIDMGLSQQPSGKPHKGAGRAKDMAREVLNEHLKHATDEERITRKGRLLKDPTENRNRNDT